MHFLPLQVYHDSEEGQRYIQFYKLNKFPYISILDPRTGEWKVSHNIIHSLITSHMLKDTVRCFFSYF